MIERHNAIIVPGLRPGRAFLAARWELRHRSSVSVVKRPDLLPGPLADGPAGRLYDKVGFSGSGGLKLQGIEAARGVAAVMVLLLHATNMLRDPGQPTHVPFGGFFLFGRAGVDFFFVLSGFIIAHVHAGDASRPSAFGLFWRKRLLRIYPTYWAVLALYCALLAISPSRERAEQDPWHVFASVLLLPDNYAYPIVAVAWSLRHELLFYALFSLVILHRRLGLAALGAWFAAVLFNIVWTMAAGQPWFEGAWGDIVFRVFNIQFLFGLAAAEMLRRGDAPRPGLMAAVGAALFLANGMAESFLPAVMQEWPPRHLVYALASALAIYGLATLDRQGRTRVPRAMLAVGSASYSVYLLHILSVLILAELLKRARPFLDLPLEIVYLLVVVITVAASVVFSRLVERPLMRIGNRIFVAERARDDKHAMPGVQLGGRGLHRGAGGDAR